MDLVTVILFLVLYYLRPQEWAGIFATVHFVQIIMLTGLATLFFREHGFRLKDLFRTPHDWAVFAFWLWMVVAAPQPWETFKESVNLYVFYIVIVQALRSVPRMKTFALWWTLLIVAVALLALASKWGFDPLESLAITNGSMKGRLMLNLSIFNNPNGLGHSVVPAIPMLYYCFIWRRPMVSRVIGFGLLVIPLSCIYLTFSKGSFLCAGITIFATLAFGRPKSVQLLLLVLAFLFGSAALFSLPRMNELNKSKNDEAIQGRVAAFKHGYGLLQSNTRGVGKGKWGMDPFVTSYVPKLLTAPSGSADQKGRVIMTAIHYNKAPHSSYVCIGAELGYMGLFLLSAIFYCDLRTVITANTKTDDEERIRRILFVLVLSYIVSSWMVDFEYRPTFFMFTAAIAALHRHLLGLLGETSESVEQPSLESALPVWRAPQLLPRPALAGGFSDSNLARYLLPPGQETAVPSTVASSAAFGIARNWNRLRLFDLGIILLITWAILRFWVYMMARM